MEDIYERSAQGGVKMIDELTKEGYEVVRVSELDELEKEGDEKGGVE